MILHVGASNVCKGQSNVPKWDFIELLNCLDNLEVLYIIGPLPTVNMGSTSSADYEGSAELCSLKGINYIDNFHLASLQARWPSLPIGEDSP